MPEDQVGEDEQLMSNLFQSQHPDYASPTAAPEVHKTSDIQATVISRWQSEITFEISATTTVGAGVPPTPLQFQAD
ncbi:hypothetical protein QC761_0049540 [Podospora bellae-mahoneyi]|uniref:Uncharacterized protein n=1 Tax=Podospora bellae-mahoneyi TaxID=2093777 RepID=A0ABR0FK93_9PEZI|nr:hypothetical protein QC761_0049540 [Podospora bellae-mahoneyi]